MKRVALLMLVVLLAGCGGSAQRAQQTTTASGLKDLHSVADLRAQFNAHAGEPRLILLMSPT